MLLYRYANYDNDKMSQSFLKQVKIQHKIWYVDPSVLCYLSEFWRLYFMGSGSIPPSDIYELNTNFEIFKICMDLLHDYIYCKSNRDKDNLLDTLINKYTFQQLIDIFTTLDLWLANISQSKYYIDEDTALSENNIKILISDMPHNIKLFSLIKMCNTYEKYLIEILDEETVLYINSINKDNLNIDELCKYIGIECAACYLSAKYISTSDRSIILSNLRHPIVPYYLKELDHSEDLIEAIEYCVASFDKNDAWKYLYKYCQDVRRHLVRILKYDVSFYKKFVSEKLSDIYYISISFCLDINPVFWFMIHHSEQIVQYADKYRELDSIEIVYKMYINDDLNISKYVLRNILMTTDKGKLLLKDEIVNCNSAISDLLLDMEIDN